MPSKGRAAEAQGERGVLEDWQQAFFCEQRDALHARQLHVGSAGRLIVKLSSHVSDDDAAAAAGKVVNDERSTSRQPGQPRSKRRIDADIDP